MLCWGSWANTQKLASKEWRFQLFYWDYSVGVLLLSLIMAFTMGSIVSGQMLVEFMFAYPGMGTLLNVGIMNGDYTLIQGVAFYLIVTTALAVLILDLAYPLLDPRITYQRS